MSTERASALFGIPVGSQIDERSLKKLYNEFAMKLHPDRNKSPEATQMFSDVAIAYAILRGKASATPVDPGFRTERSAPKPPDPEEIKRQKQEEDKRIKWTGYFWNCISCQRIYSDKKQALMCTHSSMNERELRNKKRNEDHAAFMGSPAPRP